MRVAVEPEYVFAVVETQTLAPLGQRRIRFRTPHEDHIPLPQVFAGHFEILADPNKIGILFRCSRAPNARSTRPAPNSLPDAPRRSHPAAAGLRRSLRNPCGSQQRFHTRPGTASAIARPHI